MDQHLDFGTEDRDSASILKYCELFHKNEDFSMDFPIFGLDREDFSYCNQISDPGNSGSEIVRDVENTGEIFSFDENYVSNRVDQSDDSCDLHLQDIYDFILNDENSLRREITKTANAENEETEKIDIKETLKLGIKCNSCEIIIYSRREFVSHYKDCCDKIVEYTCSACEKVFTNYLSFRSHCYRHIPNKYKCSYCDKGFSMKSKMVAHIVAIHSNERPYSCHICGKSYATQSSLSAHERKHHSSAYMCHTCGKVLLSNQGLVRHIKLHKVGRCFMCEVCGKQFHYKSHMVYHLSNSHAKQRPYTCEHCGKKFAENLHLKRHRKMHNEERPFKCENCSKTFKTKRCLVSHSRVHQTVKPFTCSYCDKGFVKLSKLKEHCNIHTGDRPFVCEFCQRSFTNRPNLLKHTKRMHRKNQVEELGEESTLLPLPSILPIDDLSIDHDLSALEQEMGLFDGISFDADFL